ncbi:MAG: CDP-alcohol phosphatidyltransferase family protein [bacterium]
MSNNQENNNSGNFLLNGLVNGFKSIDWLAHKVHKLQDTVMIPLIKRFWPRSITPNMVTSVRIILAAIIFGLIIKDYEFYRVTIITLFAVASFCDFIDGPIARALNKTSQLGAFLDPLSDKLLICPTVALLLWRYSPALVIATIALEIGAIALASVAVSKKVGFKANLWGKWKMCLQVFGVVFVFFQYITIGINIIWISVGLAIGSLLGHLQPAIVYIFRSKNGN